MLWTFAIIFVLLCSIGLISSYKLEVFIRILVTLAVARAAGQAPEDAIR